MPPHLLIDLSKCLGCSACTSVCIRGNLRMEFGKASEAGGGLGCFDCGHCLAVCPAGAISLTAYPGYEPEAFEPGPPAVEPSDLSALLARRRSVRWFRPEPLSRGELELLMSSVANSPSTMNSQETRMVVVSEGFGAFTRHLARVLEPFEGEYPRVRQFREHVADPYPMGPNPFTWEGRTVVLGFSREPEDAVVAMARVEIMAEAMGLGGFYSHWIRLADGLDHDGFMGFFPDVPRDLRLRSAFVVGRPRVRYRRSAPRSGPRVDYVRRGEKRKGGAPGGAPVSLRAIS